jgi:hypothetical protein
MMAGMGKAEGLGPDFLDDGQQDVEVTGTLPMSMTTFVGRDQELGEIRSLFREGKRLVTLVGIGGIGKTRMALELGFSAGDLGWANVYFVELAPVTSPGLVDGAVLESVGGVSSRSPLQAVVEHLREACPGCGPACGRGAVAQMSSRGDSGHEPFSARRRGRAGMAGALVVHAETRRRR